MIEAIVSEHVNAPADRARALYGDPDNWARLFPATIRGARVVRKEGNTTVVEVNHVEGKVVNILRDISATRTDLLEFKRTLRRDFRERIHSRACRHALHADGVGSTEEAVRARCAVCEGPCAREDAPICSGATQGSSGKRTLKGVILSGRVT
jgi:hypothetical protein